ncbi:hypothetical protein LCGC14_2607170, partial [marine sediment metagenome]
MLLSWRAKWKETEAKLIQKKL